MHHPGGKYSHYENYVFFRGVLERHPELLPTAVEMLRACVRREARFGPGVHTLTNALYDLYLESHDQALLQETARWLQDSLAEGARPEEVGGVGMPACIIYGLGGKD